MNRIAHSMWRGIFALVLGIVLVVWPDVALVYIVVLLGILLLVWGAVSLLSWLAYRKRDGAVSRGVPLDGVFALIFGALLVATPTSFVNALMVILGLLLIIAGVNQIAVLAGANRRGIGFSWVMYVFPVLVLIAGAVIVFNPFTSAAGVFVFFGISAIFYGLVDLYNSYSIQQRKRP